MRTALPKFLGGSGAETAPRPANDQPPAPREPKGEPLSQHIAAGRPWSRKTAAKIMTVSSAGTIEKGTIVIKGGKITAIGANVTAPAGATVIDASGRVVTPGIIDAHSHTAVEGGVNECTNIVTAEVRVADALEGAAGGHPPGRLSEDMPLGVRLFRSRVTLGGLIPIDLQSSSSLLQRRWIHRRTLDIDRAPLSPRPQRG